MPIESPEKVATHLFRVVWQLLSFVNLCDAYLGVEYNRVLREWRDAGCPVPVGEFIVKHANTSAEGVQ